MNQQDGADMNNETAPHAFSVDEDDQRFRTRVAVGTLVGVMTCLLFASLLMLISWWPNLQETSISGGIGGGGRGRHAV